MAAEHTPWRTLSAEGCDWEVRTVHGEIDPGQATSAESEILEFRATNGLRPPRRLAVRRGALAQMDEAALQKACRQARPIGGDYYGRPGKHMPDMK
ncbi:MAG: hypothetical protein ACRELD_14570 [Longimicrobiales bacterium]